MGPRAATAWLRLPVRDAASRCVHRDADFPRLAHGLDRVLFSPGVAYAACPRTRRANFGPLPARIPDVAEFDFGALPTFRPPSRDPRLLGVARRHGGRYAASTSSLTDALSHCYFLLSAFRPVDTSPLSRAFAKEPDTFARYLLRPATVRLRRQPQPGEDGDGDRRELFGVDKDDEFSGEDTVLMMLGHVMERMMTMEPARFDRLLLRDRPADAADAAAASDDHQPQPQPGGYHFAQFDDFVVRSQIDCHHPDLPGVTFDLKSRATIATRLDLGNYRLHQGYRIRHSHGLLESFEREFYDMTRTLMLKYSFQVRLGHMDGILVAYHNTQTIFGFQYVSREEMDARVFGGTAGGDAFFAGCLRLLGVILDEATRALPADHDARVTLQYMRSGKMRVFVEPLSSAAEGREATDGDGGGEEEPPEPSSFFQAGDAVRREEGTATTAAGDAPSSSPSEPMRKYQVEAEMVVDGKRPRRGRKREARLLASADQARFQYRLKPAVTKPARVREEYRVLRRSMEKWVTESGLPARDRGLVRILRRISAGKD